MIDKYLHRILSLLLAACSLISAIGIMLTRDNIAVCWTSSSGASAYLSKYVAFLIPFAVSFLGVLLENFLKEKFPRYYKIICIALGVLGIVISLIFIFANLA